MNKSIDNVEFEWVQRTVKNNFNNMKVDHIMKLGEGWMSRAYLINDQLVFRFPKEKQGAVDLEKEIKGLPILKQHISLCIPEFIYHGEQMNGFPFVGYRILSGVPMDEPQFHTLPSATRDRIAVQVAEFMDQMQSFDVFQATTLDIPNHAFHDVYADLYEEVKKKAFPEMNTEIQTYLSSRFDTYLSNHEYVSYTAKLLHADLSLDHLLYDPHKQALTGIIDFGDMKIGDPDYEYLYLLEECGETFTRKVMEIRGEKNMDKVLDKLAFFLTADNVVLLLEGLQRKNQDLIDEAIKILQNESQVSQK
ncbi:aminoglycoside 2''-phosphotransferase [Lentibacillus halodurans]|uniref:Aminoglycoside 2''-phosphotransferase n=1 Tax=Lentibacillus halodurans TaxID=237679 RepID=A0A1I0W9G5_9BACI|nr:phosphotransferase [Lentibacillus halodurans]SFA84653.1 aminoglycoside 2''-phosphotransferase [Lentibacillus halodurans]